MAEEGGRGMAGTIAVVGLGAIGEPIAATLIKAGFNTLVVPHRRRESAERLASQGATIVDTPKEAAAQSQYVLTCVPEGPDLESATLGPDGVIQGAKPGTVIIDMSTVPPTFTRDIAAKLGEKGILMVDAPISGGPARAITGELTIMVGGDAKAFETAKPVLDALGSGGKTVTHVGPIGAGELVKLANQYIISSIMIAMGEAFTFAVKGGVDAQTVKQVLSTATAGNYLMNNWIDRTIFKDEYTPGFSMRNLRKDLKAAVGAAQDMGVPTAMGDATLPLFNQGVDEAGWGADDYSAISRFAQDAANVTIATGKPRKG
jgi:3-hydroxyisobutyrate dehydrogenase-like beta-hydroxyacid dehydrogenase